MYSIYNMYDNRLEGNTVYRVERNLINKKENPKTQLKVDNDECYKNCKELNGNFKQINRIPINHYRRVLADRDNCKNPISNTLMPVSEEELLRKEDSVANDEDSDVSDQVDDVPVLANNVDSPPEDSSISTSDTTKDPNGDKKEDSQTSPKSKNEVTTGVGVPEPVA